MSKIRWNDLQLQFPGTFPVVADGFEVDRCDGANAKFHVHDVRDACDANLQFEPYFSESRSFLSSNFLPFLEQKMFVEIFLLSFDFKIT